MRVDSGNPLTDATLVKHIEQSALYVCEEVFGEGARVLLQARSDRSPGISASMPVTIENDVTSVSITATRSDCETLARTFFGIVDDSPLSSDYDLSDGLAELLNLICGRTKNVIHNKGVGIDIGIPLTSHLDSFSQSGINTAIGCRDCIFYFHFSL